MVSRVYLDYKGLAIKFQLLYLFLAFFKHMHLFWPSSSPAAHARVLLWPNSAPASHQCALLLAHQHVAGVGRRKPCPLRWERLLSATPPSGSQARPALPHPGPNSLATCVAPALGYPATCAAPALAPQQIATRRLPRRGRSRS